MEEMRNAYKILVEKREGKIPHGRLRDRWKDNIRLDLRETVSKLWTGSIWLKIRTIS
jgi:hypothetical protein